MKPNFKAKPEANGEGHGTQEEMPVYLPDIVRHRCGSAGIQSQASASQWREVWARCLVTDKSKLRIRKDGCGVIMCQSQGLQITRFLQTVLVANWDQLHAWIRYPPQKSSRGAQPSKDLSVPEGGRQITHLKAVWWDWYIKVMCKALERRGFLCNELGLCDYQCNSFFPLRWPHIFCGQRFGEVFFA